jgi:hypothetical protein
VSRRFSWPLALALTAALALGGCATTTPAPPGNVAPLPRIAQVQTGVTTKAQLLALLGPTTSIRFDSGVEVWRYMLPPSQGQAGAAPMGEYVVVLDPRGVVVKARQSERVYQIPVKK